MVNPGLPPDPLYRSAGGRIKVPRTSPAVRDLARLLISEHL